MATKKRKPRYSIGSVSSGTMRPEDLIPAFLSQLEHELKYGPKQDRATRKAHAALVRDITARMDELENYFDTDDASDDVAALEDALQSYAAPYFYFGAHPGDGADYGFWLSESWDDDVTPVDELDEQEFKSGAFMPDIKVSDTSEVPKWFRGGVVHVNERGNVTLYVKSARKLTEVWGIV